jgi:hypothetical protein
VIRAEQALAVGAVNPEEALALVTDEIVDVHVRVAVSAVRHTVRYGTVAQIRA